MSNLPPQELPPDPYWGPQIELPGSIKPLSIMAIVFASLFLLCDCISAGSSAMMMATGGKNPMLPNAPTVGTTAMHAFLVADSLIKLALAGVLLAGGISGLKISRWARGAMLWWSVAALVWATISMMVQIAWIAPAIAEGSARVQSQVNPRMPVNMTAMAKPIQIASVLAAWLFWCVMPICFLLLWRSAPVVEAFETAGQLPPGNGLHEKENWRNKP